MRIGGKGVNTTIFDVKLQCPKPLDRIDNEKDSPLPAISTNRPQIMAKATAKLNETERDNTRSLIDRSEYLFKFDPPIPLWNDTQLYSVLTTNPLPRNIVRRKLAITRHDVIPFTPGYTISNHRQAGRCVRGKGDLIGRGVDQPRRKLTNTLNGLTPFTVVDQTMLEQVSRILPHSIVDRLRDRTDRSVVEVNVVPCHGKEFAKLLIQSTTSKII